MDDKIDMSETAQMLGVSKATITNWIKHGLITSLKSSEKIFFSVNEITLLKQKLSSGDIGRLDKRANKKRSSKTFIPDEYRKQSGSSIEQIINIITAGSFDISASLFILTLKLLSVNEIFLQKHIKTIDNIKPDWFNNNEVYKIINQWFKEISDEITTEILKLYDFDLPCDKDVLGFIYQSVSSVGSKAQNGSYYTPEIIIKNIYSDFNKSDPDFNKKKIFDPCCGTGQFLLTFSDYIDDPALLYGNDIDPIAVKIATINLLVKFKNVNFKPNIFHKDFLLEFDETNIFDYIVTNPPWGFHYNLKESSILKDKFIEIKSNESFSYILNKCINMLGDKGKIAFILPESVLNVKTHEDIRKIILEKTKISKITMLNKVFKNVFTDVVCIELERNYKNNNKTDIILKNKEYQIKSDRFKNNINYIFDIHMTNDDYQMIDKLYNKEHLSLKNNALWALGIVTGDNGKYISDTKESGMEDIYKGTEISKFYLNKAKSFIFFTPEKFQQSANEIYYRAKEKLVYKFISKRLIFAYDCSKSLTLNSANILIPQIPDYPVKLTLAFLNSSVFQYIFTKKFRSIKVLRSHIESFPFLLVDKNTTDEIIALTDKLINGEDVFAVLDDIIFSVFNINNNEKLHILNEIR